MLGHAVLIDGRSETARGRNAENGRKNNSCYSLEGWYAGRPFREGWAKSRTGGRKGVNGLKCPAPMSAGGHNNTKINPVFRGMVRPRGGLLTKGKL